MLYYKIIHFLSIHVINYLGWEIYNTGQGDASCYLRPSADRKKNWNDAQRWCQEAYKDPETGSKINILTHSKPNIILINNFIQFYKR